MIDAKFIAADGCWKIEPMPEHQIMSRADIHFMVSPMLRVTLMTDNDPQYKVTAAKRTYTYFGRDTHGMPIYKESL
jgi:hypothetical protein